MKSLPFGFLPVSGCSTSDDSHHAVSKFRPHGEITNCYFFTSPSQVLRGQSASIDRFVMNKTLDNSYFNICPHRQCWNKKERNMNHGSFCEAEVPITLDQFPSS